MMKCQVCGQSLTFGMGYRHPNGELVIQREVPCENRLVGRRCAGEHCRRCGGTGRILIDDHVSQPVPA